MYTEEELKAIIDEMRVKVEKLGVPPSLRQAAISLIDQYEIVIGDTFHPLYSTLSMLAGGLISEIDCWNAYSSAYVNGRLYGYLGAVSRVVAFTELYAVKREVE